MNGNIADYLLRSIAQVIRLSLYIKKRSMIDNLSTTKNESLQVIMTSAWSHQVKQSYIVFVHPRWFTGAKISKINDADTNKLQILFENTCRNLAYLHDSLRIVINHERHATIYNTK